MRVWLDDLRDPATCDNGVAGAILSKHGREGWVWIKDIEDAKPYLLAGDIEILSCDNDLGTGHSIGRKLLDWLEYRIATDNTFPVPEKIYAHTSNPGERDTMFVIISNINRIVNAR